MLAYSYPDRVVAFLFTDTFAVLLVGGMLWFTTPFRRKGAGRDRLFFFLELCTISVILSDAMLAMLMLKRTYPDIIPFDRLLYSNLCKLFNIGSAYYIAFLLLYACSLSDRNEKLLRMIKIPILLVPIPYILSAGMIPFLPATILDFMAQFTVIVRMYVYIYRIATLMILCFVERKLMIYYLITFMIWFALSVFVPILEFTGLLYAQILVFSHIVVSNKQGVLIRSYQTDNGKLISGL